MGRGIGRGYRLTPADRLELQSRVRSGDTHTAAATAVGAAIVGRGTRGDLARLASRELVPSDCETVGSIAVDDLP